VVRYVSLGKQLGHLVKPICGVSHRHPLSVGCMKALRDVEL
jgi:hypothetical protein